MINWKEGGIGLFLLLSANLSQFMAAEWPNSHSMLQDLPFKANETLFQQQTLGLSSTSFRQVILPNQALVATLMGIHSDWEPIAMGKPLWKRRLAIKTNGSHLSPFWIVRKSSVSPSHALDVFSIHLISSLLDELFVKSGFYSVSHVPLPLAYAGIDYFYEFVTGEDILDRDEIPLGLFEEREAFEAQFLRAGINTSNDTTTHEDGWWFQNRVADIRFSDASPLPTKKWKRIDFEPTISIGFDLDVIGRFLQIEEVSLIRALGRQKTQLFQLALAVLRDPAILPSRQWDHLLFNHQYSAMRLLSRSG
jgi:hypothetical protein